MKRSSSKLISKAGSVRNINKLAYKFNYELQIESVDKVMSNTEVVVAWERGPKVVSTRPAKIDKTTRVADFGGQVLAQEVTLFKKKKEGSPFDEKVFRLSVRQGSARGKVVGKIDIDFADYCDIPSYSKRIGATLPSGGRIVMRVSSTYLGEGKSRKSSHGTASVGSHDLESDGFSVPGGDDDQRSEMEADLDDLSIGDEDDMTALPARPPPSSSQPTIKKASSLRGRGRPPNVPSSDDGIASSGGTVTRRQPSAPSPKRDVASSVELASTPAPNPRATRSRVESDVGATNGGAPSRAEHDRVRRENRTLRRRNEDLLQRNQELERQLDSEKDLDVDAETSEQLAIENAELRRDVEELKMKLGREPVYSDVVRDLREAKMALAIITIEKDELIQENRKLKRS